MIAEKRKLFFFFVLPGLSLEELLSTLKAHLKTTVIGPLASSVCALMYSRAGLRLDVSN